MRKRTQIRVACLRAKPAAADLAANWETFECFARRAQKRRADVCISPE